MAPRPVARPKATAKYYRANKEARERKADKDKEINGRHEQMEKRRELAKERRRRGMMGKGGPDLSHTKRGGLVKENASKNRARNRSKK